MNIGLSTAAFYGRWETEEAAEHLSDYGAACAEAFLQTRGEMTAGFCGRCPQKAERRSLYEHASQRNIV